MRTKNARPVDGGRGVEREWLVTGPPHGAVRFAVLDYSDDPEWPLERPVLPGDVGYHSTAPHYEGQTTMDCAFIEGRCYYDGSSLMADDWWNAVKGYPEGEARDDAIFRMLERFFTETFGAEVGP